MPVHKDVVELFDQELVKLKDIYKKHLPQSAYAYNVINLVIKWKNTHPDKNYYTIYVSDEGWEEHGTFFANIQCGCNDVFVYTLDENSDKLYNALANTRKINWEASRLFFYAINTQHLKSVIKAIDKFQCRISKIEELHSWRISKEKAINFELECPPEVYIAKLKPSHASFINQEWPNKFENSEEYIRVLIENIGGLGVHDKKTGELAAWILRNHIGILGLLQTVSKYKQRGYACLVTKAMCKEIAKTGVDPLSVVLVHNTASNRLFKKLGFERLYDANNIELLTDKPLRKCSL